MFIGAYLLVAIATERLGGETFERAVRLEIIATHLMIPLVIVLALGVRARAAARGWATSASAAERLAVQAERQRIAWELHDSAKQRVHAAHLVLSALDGRVDGRATARSSTTRWPSCAPRPPTWTRASPSCARRWTAGRSTCSCASARGELSLASPARSSVRGGLPDLPPLVATHAYRIAAEALTNAVRHSGADAHRRRAERRPRRTRSIVVRDDGERAARRRPARLARPALDAQPRRDDRRRRSTSHAARTGAAPS